MHIAVTGSSGLVGSALRPALADAGHSVRRLVRGAPRGPDTAAWDPAGDSMDPEALAGIDAVVHLGGEPIADGRWTRARKTAIRESRVGSTSLLSRAVASMASPPRVMLCASAVGIYGDRGDETLTEASPLGSGFLAEVCRAWESAADPAREAGLRVVHLRFGIVLSASGGALARMLTPFRLGVGGPLGGGRQFMSWIGLGDAVSAVLHVLGTGTMAGPVNVVSPEPVTNAEFTRRVAAVLHRPAVVPAPAIALRLAFGQMADEALLASQRVRPGLLQDSGFAFGEPVLEGAIRAALREG